MTKRWTPSQDDFERLLKWLDPSDRDRAGEKYEVIRQTLIRTFTWRGCHKPEELADETINRVMQKLPTVIETYENDPALYFYGTARYVLKECYREVAAYQPLNEQHRLNVPNQDEEREQHEQLLTCLDECLDQLTESNRVLMLHYYEVQGMAKVNFRRELADEMGVAPNALRVKVHRLRTQLHDCVFACLNSSKHVEMDAALNS